MFYGPPVIIIAICIRNETLLKVSSLSRAAIISWCTTNVCVHVCVCYVPETLTIRQTSQISSAAAHAGLQLSAWRDRFKQNKNAPRGRFLVFFPLPLSIIQLRQSASEVSIFSHSRMVTSKVRSLARAARNLINLARLGRRRAPVCHRVCMCMFCCVCTSMCVRASGPSSRSRSLHVILISGATLTRGPANAFLLPVHARARGPKFVARVHTHTHKHIETRSRRPPTRGGCLILDVGREGRRQQAVGVGGFAQVVSPCGGAR